tara:strand:+ start:325 stop:945 length:621 start_codon:yes stop_codon:yes gene_type:complete
MSSILKVDNLQTGAGATHSISSLGVTSPGTVLQEICGVCDGRTVSGVTFQNVTAYQDLTTSHTDITGSAISYTPPAGTTTVVYTFAFHHRSIDHGGISHFQFIIDGTNVASELGRRTMAGQHGSNAHYVAHHVLTFPILIDSSLSSDDISNLKLKSWTSAKTLKMSAREYNSSYDARLHHNNWWDGAGATAPSSFVVPTLSIKAIA